MSMIISGPVIHSCVLITSEIFTLQIASFKLNIRLFMASDFNRIKIRPLELSGVSVCIVCPDDEDV